MLQKSPAEVVIKDQGPNQEGNTARKNITDYREWKPIKKTSSSVTREKPNSQGGNLERTCTNMEVCAEKLKAGWQDPLLIMTLKQDANQRKGKSDNRGGELL